MRTRTILAGLAVISLAGLVATPGAEAAVTPSVSLELCLTESTMDLECAHLVGGVYVISNSDQDVFDTVDKGSWDGHTTYAYEANGTNQCVTWNSGTGDYDLKQCGLFLSAQAEWYDNSEVVVNQQASTNYGVNTCMYANEPLNGSGIVASSCAASEKDHNYWTQQ